jgi:hypothetical protein
MVFRKWIGFLDLRCHKACSCLGSTEFGSFVSYWGCFCGQNGSFFDKVGTFRKESGFGKNFSDQKADLQWESEKSPCLEAGNDFMSSLKGTNSTRLFASLKGVQKSFNE